MVLVPLLAAPSLMLVASSAERRFGPSVAGIVAAAPLAIAVITLAAGADGPPLAASAAGHVVAQVAFALAFATVVVRRGGPAAFAAAGVAFAVVSLPLALLPEQLAILAAVPALALAPRVIPVAPPEARGADSAGSLVGAAVVCGLVAVSLTAQRLSGPELAGTLSAFPALSGTFALMLTARRGPQAAATAMRGLLSGLWGYLAFCVAVALGVPPLLALAGALAVLQLRATRDRARCVPLELHT